MGILKGSKLRRAIAFLVAYLPLGVLRVLGYRSLLGYDIAQGARIGFGSVIAVEAAEIGLASIGRFNRFVGPYTLSIGHGASVGDKNEFLCGDFVLRDDLREAGYERRCVLGRFARVANRHLIDVAGRFELGEHGWLAGSGTQIWTHGVGVAERNVSIGRNTYVASAVRFSPGSSIGDQSLVALGSVVTRAFNESSCLIAGVPARVVRQDYVWRTELEADAAARRRMQLHRMSGSPRQSAP